MESEIHFSLKCTKCDHLHRQNKYITDSEQTFRTDIDLVNCAARQCSLLRRKFMECYIIKPAQSLLMKHLVIGQHQNAPDFSAFHWSPRGILVSIGQHFVITRVVHLPNRTETSLITESDRFGPIRQLNCFGPNHRIGPSCTGRA